jgi:hypothetical protein
MQTVERKETMSEAEKEQALLSDKVPSGAGQVFEQRGGSISYRSALSRIYIASDFFSGGREKAYKTTTTTTVVTLYLRIGQKI